MIAGIDEAGRGPLAGPVVAAAVVFSGPLAFEVNDSKKLSAKKRAGLAAQIKASCHWGIGMASPEEIDKINILQATLLAMTRAYDALPVKTSSAQIDGNHAPKLPCDTLCVIKGDQKVAEISAASILAKVTRDDIMLTYHQAHPEYQFDKHKGYPTKAHIAAIQAHGVLKIHRQSFKPVQQCLQARHVIA